MRPDGIGPMRGHEGNQLAALLGKQRRYPTANRVDGVSTKDLRVAEEEYQANLTNDRDWEKVMMETSGYEVQFISLRRTPANQSAQ